jgi:hypothetical protein
LLAALLLVIRKGVIMDFFDEFDDFEDEFPEELEMDYPFVDELGLEDELQEAEAQDDDFTARDAFFLGSAIGFIYEEGLRRYKRRKRKNPDDH